MQKYISDKIFTKMPVTHTPYTSLIALCLGIFLSGCAASIGNLPVYTTNKETPPSPETGRKTISIRYLGVGGYLMRYGKSAVMTAPSITNPSLLKIASLTRLKTNETLVDNLMPPAQDVEMILVGHSHYDHLLDVPYIMRKHARNAVVYGSKTMGNIIAAAVNRSCIVAVDQHAAHGKTPGQWIYNQNRTIRFMAIESEHAPHIMGLKVLPKGPYQKRLKRLPRTVFGWVEGETYAYLIDFLDERGAAVFRIHYQDAASTPPLGFVPDFSPGEQKRVDLAILCVASYNQVKDYPEGIMKNTRPRYVILGHWEDFFRNPKRPVKVLRTLNVRAFVRRMDAVKPEDAQWFLPMPFAEMHLPLAENK